MRTFPIYYYHQVPADRFEAFLQYLSKHKYRTLTADEIYSHVADKKPVPRKCIAITFDDGLSNLWTVAYPLLKKYGFCAIAFVITRLMEDREYCRPSLEDFWNNNITFQDLEFFENQEPLVTWREAYEMEKSGVVDIQSHTHRHSKCFVSPEIIDFQHPDESGSPFYLHVHDILDEKSASPYWGCPIYRSEPRMIARRYFEDVSLRDLCVSYVKSNGELRFFQRPKWREELFDLVYRYKSANEVIDSYEDESAMRAAILESLAESKRLIEMKLSKRCSHLAYPWGKANETTINYAKQLGYLTSFFTAHPPVLDNVPLQYLIRRIPGRLEYSYILNFQSRVIGRIRKELKKVGFLK